MTASEAYQVNNWRDPELMFGEEYHPFDLVRDLNGDAPLDASPAEDSYDQILDTAEILQHEENPMLDVQVKEFNALEAPLNLTTNVSEDAQSQESVNEAGLATGESSQTLHPASDMVLIQHFDAEGPMIFVTKKRHDRIIKQRTKRLEFLKVFPEYALPYKNREKKIKYKTRSKMAKDRKRNSLGKFSNLKKADQFISFEIDPVDLLEETNRPRKRKT